MYQVAVRQSSPCRDKSRPVHYKKPGYNPK